MQIVIDIPAEDYKRVVDKWEINATHVIDAILKGTPLPKGHGRLIDADKIKYHTTEKKGIIISQYITSAGIRMMPTVIKADEKFGE